MSDPASMVLGVGEKANSMGDRALFLSAIILIVLAATLAIRYLLKRNDEYRAQLIGLHKDASAQTAKVVVALDRAVASSERNNEILDGVMGLLKEVKLAIERPTGRRRKG